MNYPEYAAFTKRYGEGPEPYFEKLTLARLQCIARELEITFIPPFGADDPEEIIRQAIIDAAVADFQEPGQDEELIRAVEKCVP